MTINQNYIKLSAKQTEVMEWLGKGWSAQPDRGSVYTVNGGKERQGLDIRVGTLNALEKLGLVEQDVHLCFQATNLGKQLVKNT